MSQKYCVRKKTNVSVDKEKALFYAVPVSSGIIRTKALASIISDRCTGTSSDVLLVLDALSTVMKEQLLQGKKVHLNDIGLFSLSLSSPGFENPKDCTPRKVTAKRICYLADKDLKSILPEVEFKRVD
jgi:predicted histone-like DNA-binding protein